MRPFVLAELLAIGVAGSLSAACAHESPPPMVPDPVEPIGATDVDAGAVPDASPDSPLIPIAK